MFKTKTFRSMAAIICLLPVSATAEVTLSANGVTDTYDLIELVLGPGALDIPDEANCTPQEIHNTDHVTQIYDSSLSEYVFYFHAHLDQDADCTTHASHKQRTEIKVTPQSGWGHMQGSQNETHTYRWKFRVSSVFTASGNFTHIFQIKAKSGSDANMPLMTLTPRNNVLQLVHYPNGDTTNVVESIPLSAIKGKWIEAYVKAKYSDGSSGTLRVTLRRLDTGATVLDWHDDNLDMWRPNGAFNRPKWGIYRDKTSSVLQNEHLRYDDFCIAQGSDTCPSYFDPPPPPPPPPPPSCPYYDPERGVWIQCP